MKQQGQYEVIVLGEPPEGALLQLKDSVAAVTKELLISPEQFNWCILPKPYAMSYAKPYEPKSTNLSCIVFFASENTKAYDLSKFADLSIPFIPVVDKLVNVSHQVPEALMSLNCLALADGNNGVKMLTTTVISTLGLLPKQRRVCISYRRRESTPVALQLFNALSARRFEVFVDIHGILAAEDFQTSLEQRFHECDVLIMLDTETYIESHWTKIEYGWALARGITMFRLGWPDATQQGQTSTVTGNVELDASDFTTKKTLYKQTLAKVCEALEVTRIKGMAIRQTTKLNKLRDAIEYVNGEFVSIANDLQVQARLESGQEVALRPVIGVPTVHDLERADKHHQTDKPLVMVYEKAGIKPDYQQHLEWLQSNIKRIPWYLFDKLNKELITLGLKKEAKR